MMVGSRRGAAGVPLPTRHPIAALLGRSREWPHLGRDDERLSCSAIAAGIPVLRIGNRSPAARL